MLAILCINQTALKTWKIGLSEHQQLILLLCNLAAI